MSQVVCHPVPGAGIGISFDILLRQNPVGGKKGEKNVLNHILNLRNISYPLANISAQGGIETTESRDDYAVTSHPDIIWKLRVHQYARGYQFLAQISEN